MSATGGQQGMWQPIPTDREKDLFVSVVKHLQEKPSVDWDKVAAEMELKNSTIAKVRYNQIRKKLGWDGMTAPASMSATADNDGGLAGKMEDGGDEPATPLKTPRKPRAPRKPRTPKGGDMSSPSPSKKRKSLAGKAENNAPDQEMKLEVAGESGYEPDTA